MIYIYIYIYYIIRVYMYVCFWDVERSWWRQRCLAGSAQFPTFFSCRPAEQQHIPSSLGEGAENLTARSFNERVVGKKRTYFESTSMSVYTYHIYLYVCIRIVYMFFIVVAYSVFRKPEKWSTETQTVVLLFSSKDQLQKLKRQGWTFWMYILKLTYVFYLSIHVCNTVTYLFVNLKIFDVHTDTWGPGHGGRQDLGFCRTSAVSSYEDVEPTPRAILIQKSSELYTVLIRFVIFVMVYSLN